MDFTQWVMDTFGLDASTLTPGQTAKFQAIYDAEMSATDDSEMDAADGEAVEPDAAAEKKKPSVAAARKSATKLAAAIGTDGSSTDETVDRAVKSAIKATRMEGARQSRLRALAKGDEAKVQGWIADGSDPRDVELTELRAGRARHSGAATQEKDHTGDVYAAALLLNSSSMRAARLKDFYDEKTLNLASGKEFRGFSLVECADRLIRMAGVSYRGQRNQAGHMLACRDASVRLEAAAGFTGMTLSSILENVSDKVLLDSYAAVETLWNQIAAVRSLSDFKVHSQYALDPTSTFKKVGPQGDFAALEFSDRKYSLQAGSYGVRVKVDFQTWRNDDLGAISDRMATIGNLAATTVEQVIFTLLMAGLNNASLCHASNSNYDATSASVFGVAGLTFAEKMWDNAVRPNGTPLGVSPQLLLVGTALKTLAGQVFTSTKLNDIFGSGVTAKQNPGENPFASKYRPVVAPYLNNTLLKDTTGPVAASLSHQADDVWMLIARQGNNAPMHVGFLDGRQEPAVEIINNQSEQIGFELAAGLHFGGGYGDPKLITAFNPSAT